MSDFSSVQPIGGYGYAPRPTPPPQTQAVAALVETGAGQTSNEYNKTKPQQALLEQPEDAIKQDHIDPDELTGPPPSFRASLLEVESQLENIIKRVEAAREFERNSQAVAAEKGAETRADINGDPGALAATTAQAQGRAVDLAS